MVTIHGIIGSENELIKYCHEINNYTDINLEIKRIESKLEKEKVAFLKKQENMEKTLSTKKNEFFKNLPKRINKKKQEILICREKIVNITSYWEKKIECYNNKDSNNILHIFKYIINYIKIFVINNFLKPKDIKEYKNKLNIINKELEILINNPRDIFENEEPLFNKFEKIKNNPDKAFNEEYIELINSLEERKECKNSTEYTGAEGENKVLKKLKKLDNSYHIFCDINIKLDRFYSYKKRYNLKSAQIDFVIVCLKGIFVLEVKNRSNSYLKNHNGLSPYEQVDRAGRILRIYLNNNLSRNIIIDGKITNILIPTQNNMYYNKHYKSIMVKNIYNINRFIQNKEDILYDDEIEEIITLLKPKINTIS